MLYTRTEQDANRALDMMSQAAELCLPKGSMEELILSVGCYVR
jgi:hypothetical protein